MRQNISVEIFYNVDFQMKLFHMHSVHECNTIIHRDDSIQFIPRKIKIVKINFYFPRYKFYLNLYLANTSYQIYQFD